MSAPEVLVAPSADDLFATYLRSLLGSTPCAIEVPEPRPAEFVRVMLTGGAGRRNVAQHEAQVTVEGWAGTAEEASTLMHLADAHMHNARYADIGVFTVSALGAPVSLPDPDSGSPRYTASYLVLLRTTAQ